MRKFYLNHILNDFDEFYNAVSGCNASNCCQAGYEGLSIAEDEEHVFVEAELPGLRSDQVEVTLDPQKRRLQIRGENPKKREDVKYLTCSKREFAYDIPLSNRVDLDGKLDAVSRDGILHITLSKNRSHKPLRIEVKS